MFYLYPYRFLICMNKCKRGYEVIAELSLLKRSDQGTIPRIDV